MISGHRESDVDQYMDGREFLPSEMERLVRRAFQEKAGSPPEALTVKEVEMRWELFLAKRKAKKLNTCKMVLAAACVFLSVGLAAALWHPVGVQGSNTCITFVGADGEEEQFVFHYKDLDDPGGRTHKYKSYRELEAALGFSLVRPSGESLNGLYLEKRPESGFYEVTAYFDRREDSVIGSYQAYFVKAEEASYGYSHEISQDWKKNGEQVLGGRRITLYRIEGGNAAYGAAFTEDGIFYMLSSCEEVKEQQFLEALEALGK